MNEQQITTLDLLQTVLVRATEDGTLDELAAEVHPDVINKFCDAVTSAQASA